MMMKKTCGSERSGVRRSGIVVGYLHHFKRSPLGLLLRLASGKDALHRPRRRRQLKGRTSGSASTTRTPPQSCWTTRAAAILGSDGIPIHMHRAVLSFCISS